ncbi:MAG: fumarylacetoacetate hydrolase family protein [Candidatus Firestonebacteria bacterium]
MKIFAYKHGDIAPLGFSYKGKKYCLSGLLRLFYFQKAKQLPWGFGLKWLLENELLDEKLVKEAVQFAEKTKVLSRYLLKKDIKLLPPLLPGKIIALGRNFAKHAKEQNAPVPAEPILFEKAASSVIGPEAAVVYPAFMVKEFKKEARVDHEVELAVVIGRKASKIKAKDAMKYVFGYTIINDISARNIQAIDFKKNQPWFRSKYIDTFCPLGPVVVTKDEIKDPHNLKLELRVNGKVKQTDSTKSFIFKIPAMLEYITKYLTLMPGDVISTGTPDGISALKPGDVMEAEIENIGILRNRVIKE